MIAHDPIANDLRWFLLGDYRGDLGVRSSMAATIEVLRRGGHVEGAVYREIDEAMIDAATRLKRLSRRWDSLGSEHQRTLTTHYATTQRVLPEWSGLGALVLSRPLAAAEHLKSRSTRHLVAWLARLPVRTSERAVFERIKLDAEHALEAARHAWRGAR